MPGAADDVAVMAVVAGVAKRGPLPFVAEEYDLELLECAPKEVQSPVETRTWEAFRLTAEEGLSGAEVADRLTMNVAAVFRVRSRVQQMLRERVESEDE